MTAKASSKQMKNLTRHINCKHKLLLQESVIDRNNEILQFKRQIHNQSTKLNDFIQFMNYLVRRNICNMVICQSVLKQRTEAVAQRCSFKNLFLEISQNSQENSCARASFLMKLQVKANNFIKKETDTDVFLLILRDF